MQRLNFKVYLFRRKRANFIALSNNVGAEDLKLGEKSPLSSLLDMNLFRTEVSSAKDMFAKTKALHNDGEMFTEKAYLLIGVYKGQDSRTPNTLYSSMSRIKIILTNAYYDNREELQKFGFTVVQGKKGYNIRLPRNSPFIVLNAAKKCVDRHLELGKKSPLLGYDMQTFEKNNDQAKEYINNARKYHDDAEAISEKLNNLLGFSKKQNIRTPYTLYYKLGKIRDYLLVLYFGQEKQIEDWGFKIIISTSKKHKKTEENEKPEK